MIAITVDSVDGNAVPIMPQATSSTPLKIEIFWSRADHIRYTPRSTKADSHRIIPVDAVSLIDRFRFFWLVGSIP